VYQAVWVARKAFTERHPLEWQALLNLQGSIGERAMIDMNAQADIQHLSFAKIAAQHLGSEAPRSQSLKSNILQRTREHLWLVGIAAAVFRCHRHPIGPGCVRFHAAGQAILIFSALIQTVPSLALLCFLIPLFGVGMKTGAGGAVPDSLLPVVLQHLHRDPQHRAQARGECRARLA